MPSKKLFPLLFSLLLCLAPGSALCASAAVSGDYEYRVDGDGAVITRYNGSEADVTIPAALDGLPVIEIGGAFRGNEAITRVTVPAGVKEIGSGAFYGSGLAAIELPEGLERLGDSAFESCTELTTVAIPASVQRIGVCAFRDCRALENIGVDPGNAWFAAPDGVLYSGDMKALYAYPIGRSAARYDIPAGATAILDGAFFASALSAVTLPEGVERIGFAAFDGCRSLKRIELPASAVSIAYHFRFAADCPALEEIGVSPDNPVYASLDGVLYDKPMTTLLAYPIGRLESSFTVPAGVKAIASEAFSGCRALSSVLLPDGLEFIDTCAFRFSGLEKIALPASVRAIGDSAFGYCENLTLSGEAGSLAQAYAQENNIPFDPKD